MIKIEGHITDGKALTYWSRRLRDAFYIAEPLATELWGRAIEAECPKCKETFKIPKWWRKDWYLHKYSCGCRTMIRR